MSCSPQTSLTIALSTSDQACCAPLVKSFQLEMPAGQLRETAEFRATTEIQNLIEPQNADKKKLCYTVLVSIDTSSVGRLEGCNE